MLYDFACKIKNVQDKDNINDEALRSIIDGINASYDVHLDFKFVLPSGNAPKEFLIKAQASISSMPNFHNKELEIAVEAFKTYLKEVADVVHGEVSENDGFYNNTQNFWRLYN